MKQGVGFGGVIGRLTVVCALAGLGAATHAGSLSFDLISANAPVNIESQLSASLTTPGSGSGYIEFTIRNEGPTDSTIKGVLFGGLDGLVETGSSSVTLDPGPGVDFKYKGNGGGSWSFGDIDYQAVTNGGNANGIDPGEFLSIEFELLSGLTIDDVESAFGAGTSAIGLHVGSIGSSGESDKFVSYASVSGSEVPEPAETLLVVAGLTGLIVQWRRMRRQSDGSAAAQLDR